MKINNFAVLGLFFFGSVEGSPGALVPNLAAAASESSRASNLQRELVGSTITFENDCGELTGDDQCCDNTCTLHSLGNERSFNAPIGSCNGVQACDSIGYLTLGEYSCVGHQACYTAGQFYYENHPGTAAAIVGVNSCKGFSSCDNIASEGDVTIGSGSCLGNDFLTVEVQQAACKEMGKQGNAVTGDNSCIGIKSCANFGQEMDAGATSIIGSGSCIGDNACQQAAYDGGGAHIGDNSCNGEGACYRIGYNRAHRVVVGSTSCNCEDCCRCVEVFDNGSGNFAVIPDESCNSRGSGNNQCCTEAGLLNPNFDFDNAADATVTDPSAPQPQPYSNAVAPPEYSLSFSGCSFVSNSADDVEDFGDIVCSFTASGGTDHTVTSEIYGVDCESSSTPPAGVAQDEESTFDRTVVTDSNQESSTYQVTISVAHSAVLSGGFQFCLMTDVKDSTGEIYDFIGQKISLPATYDGNFNVGGLTTEASDGITQTAADAGTASFTVDAFRCNIAGTQVSDDLELSLGENFFLCVEGSQSSVRIVNIESLLASKDNIENIDLIAADGSTPSTFLYGLNTNKAVIATRLPSRFFSSDGAITLTGTAVIENGGGRRLARLMQETSTSEEASEFSMDIPVVASSVFKTAGGSTKGPVGVFMLAVTAAVALFV